MKTSQYRQREAWKRERERKKRLVTHWESSFLFLILFSVLRTKDKERTKGRKEGIAAGSENRSTVAERDQTTNKTERKKLLAGTKMEQKLKETKIRKKSALQHCTSIRSDFDLRQAGSVFPARPSLSLLSIRHLWCLRAHEAAHPDITGAGLC